MAWSTGRGANDASVGGVPVLPPDSTGSPFGPPPNRFTCGIGYRVVALFAMSRADWVASALSVGGPASLGLMVGLEIDRPGTGALSGLLAGLVLVALFGWRRRHPVDGDER